MPKYRMLIAVVGIISLCAVSSQADFSWFNTDTNVVSYNGGTVPLPWGSDETEGCFVELIWAGPNGIVDAFDVGSLTGVSGDDQVQQVSYIGANVFGDGISDNGLWSGSSNGYYYVRVFSAPSPNFAAYQYPTDNTNFYAESALWLSPGGASDQFNFGGNGLMTDHPIIPEPAALGLGIIGLISLRLFSRKRK